ncbi:XdhC family protein [Sphingopyxis indica]|uniref:Xanthine dehydrogenase accessory factor n=1 Tax=Sphingopyxis indica TaxID=436663 RepID=A0A239K1N7_9SPHN|nr:XdhC family protein [Sphingopyxis indica]SNT11612.1 xanthine dehydrogenase accessory factor [Sphingopyxis indica]
MTGLAIRPDDILRFVGACADEGVAAALVTLTAIEGSSPRAIGAQMAVAEDGRSIGSFSGGCIEAAVVAEARGVLAADRAKLVRFGAGSPYIDVRLPCGGGIDLLFTPRPDRAAIDAALARIDARQGGALILSPRGVHAAQADVETGWDGDSFALRYPPRLRIVAIGQGEDLIATARLAQFYGAETLAFSPLPRDVAALECQGIAARHLATRHRLPALWSDASTAFIFLFHDRDWEETLLPWALAQPAFYIGAVGSPRAQAARRGMLAANGVDRTALAALRPHVGLIPSTRDPATLALSIVAEIVEIFGAGTSVAGVSREHGVTASDAAKRQMPFGHD